ncbi:BYS1 domain protein [Penicillium lagena]|uniref:BYS1 domain protein n=1 Tax=Penicillium lagena TaxID=94218 RepID=UPI0025416228|nr:BYS1 domain protein [Penicillium lagena]KAJ5621077.1 BYS1 domain protein [Penicillium lagena]
MHFSIALTTLAALAPLVSAVGDAIVVNNCKAAVHLWSVGGAVGPEVTLNPGEEFTEKVHYDAKSGGIAIKITRPVDGLYTGAPQTDFAYTLDGNNLWYDLSDVFGDPFSGKVLSVKASNPDCPDICWSSGISPAGSQTKVCGAAANITLTLCAAKC